MFFITQETVDAMVRERVPATPKYLAPARERKPRQRKTHVVAAARWLQAAILGAHPVPSQRSTQYR